jgi:glutathione S-transferase
MKKVPAIEDTEAQITLAESHAIMRYLCAKYKLN